MTTLSIKKDSKDITICTTFKRLEETGRTFKDAVAILQVEVNDKSLDIEVKWDSFESEYSLDSDSNKSYRDVENTLLACFDKEQLTDKNGNHTKLYYALVNDCMERISNFLCEFAEQKIYAEF